MTSSDLSHKLHDAQTGIRTTGGELRGAACFSRGRRSCENNVPDVELLRSNHPQEDLPLKKFLRSEEGIAVTEYGLLVALIAIALIAVVTVFGQQISSWFAKKTGQITTV